MNLGDRFDPQPVVRSTDRFDGLTWAVRTDEVRLSHGETVTRDYVVHPGAVGIIALDADERVLLIQQYRHPVGHLLWEPPAGLMDLAGETPLATAKRELVEEAGLLAGRWNILADWFNSPGGSTEAFRCFLARDISEAEGGRPPGTGEETHLPAEWLPLDEAVALVFAGRLSNPTAVTGILAAAQARADNWEGLRPADSPWPARSDLLDTDRIWLP